MAFVLELVPILVEPSKWVRLKGQGYLYRKTSTPSDDLPVFLMSKYPVTQAQWKAVAALPKVDRDLISESACFKGDNRPVERVSCG